MAEDIRRAAADAVFPLPEAQLSVPPIFGLSQRLYKTIGIGGAKELLFTGRIVDAAETLSLDEGYDVGLKEEVTAFSEAFNPDTGQWERL